MFPSGPGWNGVLGSSEGTPGLNSDDAAFHRCQGHHQRAPTKLCKSGIRRRQDPSGTSGLRTLRSWATRNSRRGHSNRWCAGSSQFRHQLMWCPRRLLLDQTLERKFKQSVTPVSKSLPQYGATPPTSRERFGPSMVRPKLKEWLWGTYTWRPIRRHWISPHSVLRDRNHFNRIY